MGCAWLFPFFVLKNELFGQARERHVFSARGSKDNKYPSALLTPPKTFSWLVKGSYSRYLIEHTRRLSRKNLGLSTRKEISIDFQTNRSNTFLYGSLKKKPTFFIFSLKRKRRKAEKKGDEDGKRNEKPVVTNNLRYSYYKENCGCRHELSKNLFRPLDYLKPGEPA